MSYSSSEYNVSLCESNSSLSSPTTLISQPSSKKKQRKQKHKFKPVLVTGDFDRMSRRMWQVTTPVLVPILLTISIVVWSILYLTPPSDSSEGSSSFFGILGSSDSSTKRKLLIALISAGGFLIFIIVMTFAIILLYKYRYMKILFAWLGISAAIYYFLITWIWLDLFFDFCNIPYDLISISLTLWNIGIVGIISTFYYGPPRILQGYLIVLSVCLAWLLNRLPEWTTWALLIIVAIYDLVAVLWKYGPLAILIKEVQKRDDPIPAFIYDTKTKRDGRLRRNSELTPTEGDDVGEEQSPDESSDKNHHQRDEKVWTLSSDGTNQGDDDSKKERVQTAFEANIQIVGQPSNKDDDDGIDYTRSEEQQQDDDDELVGSSLMEMIHSSIIDHSDTLKDDWTQVKPYNPTPQETKASIKPDETAGNNEEEEEKEKREQPKEQQREQPEPMEEKEHQDPFTTVENVNPLKLGLGDFIFYSLLVGRAAQSNFISWIVCFFVVCGGLLATLIILIFFRGRLPALPALPFSIFAGTIVYFLFTYTVVPMASYLSYLGSSF